MADPITFEFKQDQIGQKLNEMLDRTQTIQSYLNRVVWSQYQKAQITRWETENSSEGAHWEPLDPEYQTRKLKRFAAFDGAGRVMMIATGKLMKGATGQDSSGFNKIVTNQGIKVGLNLESIPYAAYASEKRPTMAFGKQTRNLMKKGLQAFIAKGEERYEG